MRITIDPHDTVGVAEECDEIKLFADSDIDDFKISVNLSGRGQEGIQMRVSDDPVDLIDNALAMEVLGTAIPSILKVKVEPKQEEDDGQNSQGDLVCGTGTASIAGVGEGRKNKKAHQACIGGLGGLAWWTTEKDIEEILKDIGVIDSIDIKFCDHRSNGKSKGYCIISVGSPMSLRLVHEKLPKRKLHEKELIVTPFTREALIQLEAETNSPPRKLQQQHHQQKEFTPLPPTMMGTRPRGSPMMGMPPPPMGCRPRGMIPLRGPLPPGFCNNNGPNPRFGFNGPPPGFPPQRPPPGYQSSPLYGNCEFQPCGPRGERPRPMPPRGPPPPGWNSSKMGPCGLPPDPSNGWNQPPAPGNYNPTGMPEICNPPARHNVNNVQTECTPSTIRVPPPAPHLNPAFIHHSVSEPFEMLRHGSSRQDKVVSGGEKPKEGPSGPGFEYSSRKVNKPAVNDKIDHDPDEILNRNKMVSSSAIVRAVDDASKGDFASAIETLVTAISLLKHSQGAGDERCQILMSSLRDALTAIEDQGYFRVDKGGCDSKMKKGRCRSSHRRREREASVDRYAERSRDRSRRSRSRSRDRVRPGCRSIEDRFERHERRDESERRHLEFRRNRGEIENGSPPRDNPDYPEYCRRLFK